MQRITIELISEDAIQKVRQLEEQNVLRVITPGEPRLISHRKWSGSISKETAQRMLVSVKRGREAWNRI